MRSRRTMGTRRAEAGIALLISIFILLLISVVAIALIVSSGTETALAGNYRSSTSVYYDAIAGLEEARGRLLGKGPSAFKTTDPSTFLPAPGTSLVMGNTYYLVNPVSSETVAPWDSTSLYPDNQFFKEFGASGFANPTSPSPTALSVWNRSALNPGNYPGPLYKWVRINAVSEKSLNVDADNDGLADSTTPLYYDGAHFSNSASAGSQVLELTAFAILPNGSQKILQYVVAPQPLNLNFPAALTLDGNNVQFSVPTSSSFWVKGIDQGSVGSCNPGASAVSAVGYTNGSDNSHSNIVSEIPSGPSPTPDLRGNYTNGTPSTPNVNLVSLSPNLTTIAGLDALVQTITDNADAVISGPVTQSDSTNYMPAAMSPTNPMTVVVNGDLAINGWHSTGYGLLLVTGKLTYDPDATWNGIILVIGKGWVYSYQGGTGQFQGEMLLAKTVDASNNPLPLTSPLGSPFFDFTTSSGGTGVYYSSCWIQAATPSAGYKILSFHEIAQQ